ncbi:hypothetical protein [Bradyrhizobium sp.]|uniref:hypothetical protein n=1 Tax=Bradyrhizobium sp. TaxID=376 RepID=UPI003C3BA0B3
MNLSRAVVLSFFALGVGLVSLSGSRSATAECSVHTLQGSYLFHGRGINVHYGVLEFDGAGNFSGKQTSIRQPNVASAQRETLHGNYAINADCTGEMEMDGQIGGTAHWDIFVTADGKKGRMIRTDAGRTGVRTFEQ